MVYYVICISMNKDEFFNFIEEVCDELPDVFFRELHYGVIMSDDLKISPQGLIIMGEYKKAPYGNQITIYYGSFERRYPNLEGEELKDKIREVVRHEFRHHMENLANMHGRDSLEYEDEVKLNEYMRGRM